MAMTPFRTHRNRIAVIALATAMIFTAAGCSSEKLYSDPAATASSETTATTTNPNLLSYDYVTNRLTEYDTALNAYMREETRDVTSTETDGTTFAGTPAHCTYTIAKGGSYHVLQLEKTTDTTTSVDEYFDLSDALFVARTTYHSDTSTYDPVEKYYITGGIVYKLNPETKTLDAVVDLAADNVTDAQTELDMYFSFDEINEIYG